MKIQISCLLLVTTLLLSNLPYLEELNTELLTEEESTILIEKLSGVVDYNERTHAEFEEFAISDDGDFAITIRKTGKVYVNVYDSYGNFNYSVSFNTTGYLLLEWEDDQIGILFPRAGIICFYSKEGVPLLCRKVLQTPENNTYMSSEMHSNIKSVGTYEYYAAYRGNINSASVKNDTLIRSDNSTETILYTAIPEGNNDLFWMTIPGILIVTALVLRNKSRGKTGVSI